MRGGVLVLRHPEKDYEGDLWQRLYGQKWGTKHELHVFPGTQHGFCFPERAVYDTLASEETWRKMFAMWDRHLK